MPPINLPACKPVLFTSGLKAATKETLSGLDTEARNTALLPSLVCNRSAAVFRASGSTLSPKLATKILQSPTVYAWLISWSYLAIANSAFTASNCFWVAFNSDCNPVMRSQISSGFTLKRSLKSQTTLSVTGIG